MDTALGRRRIEDELRLAILLLHSVGMTNHDGVVWITVRGNAQTEQTRVDPKGEDRRPQDNEQCAHNGLPEPLPEFGRCQRHETRL